MCDGLQIALQNYKAQSIETSVTTGKNVKKAFYNLAESLIFSHNIFQPGREVSQTVRRGGRRKRWEGWERERGRVQL